MRPCAVVWIAALVLAACGSGGSAPSQEGRIDVELRSFKFTPSRIVLRAGETVTLALRDPDEVEHE